MALPKIKHPTYDARLVSLGIDIKIRPFTVKEEKILLLAQNSKDPKDAIEAVKQIVSNCIVDQTIDIDNLPLFDLEYLFIKIRACSVDNKMNVRVKTPDGTKDLEVDLDKVYVKNYDKGSEKVNIGGGIGIIFRYPDFSDLEYLASLVESEDREIHVINLMNRFMTAVYDEEQVLERNVDFNDEEIEEFVDNLSTESTKDIQRFFNNIPTITYETVVMLKDGTEYPVVIQGLQSFFT